MEEKMKIKMIVNKY